MRLSAVPADTAAQGQFHYLEFIYRDLPGEKNIQTFRGRQAPAAGTCPGLTEHFPCAPTSPEKRCQFNDLSQRACEGPPRRARQVLARARQRAGGRARRPGGLRSVARPRGATARGVPRGHRGAGEAPSGREGLGCRRGSSDLAGRCGPGRPWVRARGENQGHLRARHGARVRGHLDPARRPHPAAAPSHGPRAAPAVRRAGSGPTSRCRRRSTRTCSSCMASTSRPPSSLSWPMPRSTI